MMAAKVKPWTASALGVLAGALALFLLTAVVVGAIASARADDRTEALATKLERVTNDLTALRDNQAAQQQGTLKARSTLMHQNKVLQYQIRVSQQQNKVLIRLLRSMGVKVPESAIAPPVGSVTRPKAHRSRTSRGTQTPTAPRPSAPSPSCFISVGC